MERVCGFFTKIQPYFGVRTRLRRDVSPQFATFRPNLPGKPGGCAGDVTRPQPSLLRARKASLPLTGWRPGFGIRRGLPVENQTFPHFPQAFPQPVSTGIGPVKKQVSRHNAISPVSTNYPLFRRSKKPQSRQTVRKKGLDQSRRSMLATINCSLAASRR